MSKENSTVSLSSENSSHLKDFVNEGIFIDETAGYKFAIAYAIKHSLSPLSKKEKKTKYAIGSLDPNNELRDAVKFLHPDAPEGNDKILDFLQGLSEAGMSALAKIKQDTFDLDLSELIKNK